MGIEGKDAEDKKALLQKCASTTLNSKLASHPLHSWAGAGAACQQCPAGCVSLALIVVGGAFSAWPPHMSSALTTKAIALQQAQRLS